MRPLWIQLSLGFLYVVAVAPAVVVAQTYTIGGFTFNQNDTPTHLTRITSWNHGTPVRGISEIIGNPFDAGYSPRRTPRAREQRPFNPDRSGWPTEDLGIVPGGD